MSHAESNKISASLAVMLAHYIAMRGAPNILANNVWNKCEYTTKTILTHSYIPLNLAIVVLVDNIWTQCITLHNISGGTMMAIK